MTWKASARMEKDEDMRRVGGCQGFTMGTYISVSSEFFTMKIFRILLCSNFMIKIKTRQIVHHENVWL